MLFSRFVNTTTFPCSSDCCAAASLNMSLDELDSSYQTTRNAHQSSNVESKEGEGDGWWMTDKDVNGFIKTIIERENGNDYLLLTMDSLLWNKETSLKNKFVSIMEKLTNTGGVVLVCPINIVVGLEADKHFECKKEEGVRMKSVGNHWVVLVMVRSVKSRRWDIYFHDPLRLNRFHSLHYVCLAKRLFFGPSSSQEIGTVVNIWLDQQTGSDCGVCVCFFVMWLLVKKCALKSYDCKQFQRVIKQSLVVSCHPPPPLRQ